MVLGAPTELPMTGEGGTDLTGLADRLPRVETVLPGLGDSTTARTGLAGWRAAWSTRHTVATLVITPMLWAAYRSAAGPEIAGSFAWTWLLLLTALVGAAALATYLPRPRGARAMGSPCAALAGAHVVLAAVVLSMGPSVPMRGIFAFAIVTFSLVQRMAGSAACSVR